MAYMVFVPVALFAVFVAVIQWQAIARDIRSVWGFVARGGK